ncbi:uncharacterized protein yc1106_04073 [Curvularia clavata]|uniref:Uncharacterized protein n=1 Tax=Curvularia clavata TaxID=95742 RepID=A0A9Q8Z6A2_CURCL|nr:uncharacterized protein yc1106_04073 [Curvularia clavata]
MVNQVAREHKGPAVQRPEDTSNKVLNASEALRNMTSRKERVTPEPIPALTDTLGIFGKLPAEVRNNIFFKAMEVDERPIHMKACGCVPSHLLWQVGKCDKDHAKYPVGTGRFNLLYVSKPIRQEAMQVMYTLCKLHIVVDNNIPKYLCGTRSKKHNLPPMWNSIAQFHEIHIEVSPIHIKAGHPVRYTDRVLNILQNFQKHHLASEVPIKDLARRTRIINFGNLFHSTLPFNFDNPTVRIPVVLAGWITFQSQNPREPGFHQLQIEARDNLHRIVQLIRELPHRDGWKILVNTHVDGVSNANRPGGKREFEEFKSYCEEHGVELAHTDGPKSTQS